MVTRFFRGAGGLGVDQARPACPVDEVLDRGGRPFRFAARRALVKFLELGRDLAQRQLRIGRMNAGGQCHQPVFGKAGRGLLQQARIGHVLGHQPFHRPAQTLRRPVEAALLQNAGDVIPGMVRPHAPNGRRPLVGRRLNSVPIGSLLRGRHLC